jgi:hypothetical protein
VARPERHSVQPPGAGGVVDQLFATRWQIILAVGILDLCEPRGPLVGQRPPAPQQGTGGAPRGGRDGGLREPAAPEQGGKLGRIALVIGGLPPLDGLQVQRMPKDKRAPVGGTQVRQPVPGAQTCDGADETRARGSKGVEEGMRVGLQRAMHAPRAPVVEEAEGHRPGMQGDAPGKWVLRSVQSPCGLLLLRK